MPLCQCAFRKAGSTAFGPLRNVCTVVYVCSFGFDGFPVKGAMRSDGTWDLCSTVLNASEKKICKANKETGMSYIRQ